MVDNRKYFLIPSAVSWNSERPRLWQRLSVAYKNICPPILFTPTFSVLWCFCWVYRNSKQKTTFPATMAPWCGDNINFCLWTRVFVRFWVDSLNGTDSAGRFLLIPLCYSSFPDQLGGHNAGHPMPYHMCVISYFSHGWASINLFTSVQTLSPIKQDADYVDHHAKQSKTQGRGNLDGNMYPTKEKFAKNQVVKTRKRQNLQETVLFQVKTS